MHFTKQNKNVLFFYLRQSLNGEQENNLSFTPRGGFSQAMQIVSVCFIFQGLGICVNVISRLRGDECLAVFSETRHLKTFATNVSFQ